MTTAAQLVAQIHEDLKETEEQLRHHPYLQALGEGRVSVEALRAFPGHQYQVVASDLRSLALMLQRFGDTPARDLINGVLQGEFAALESLPRLARKLGMSDADLHSYEPTAEGFAYATYMAWLALYGSAAEFVCGIFVNFTAWAYNCGRMSAALREHYGFAEADTAFLDSFANAPSIEVLALEIIQDGLDHGVDPRRIHRATRLFQSYERQFWDTMARIAGLV